MEKHLYLQSNNPKTLRLKSPDDQVLHPYLHFFYRNVRTLGKIIMHFVQNRVPLGSSDHKRK